MKINKKKLEKYSLSELLSLSNEIQQIINNKNLSVEKIEFEESKKLAIFYKKAKNYQEIRNYIEYINNFIVEKNNQLASDDSKNNKLEELMSDEDKNAKYIIVKKPSGEYTFKLINNNKVLLESEGYTRFESCQNGIVTVKKGIQGSIFDLDNNTFYSEKQTKVHSKFEIWQDRNKKYRFRLKASNGQIIATSSAHESRQKCIDTIVQTRKYALVAEIVIL